MHDKLKRQQIVNKLKSELEGQLQDGGKDDRLLVLDNFKLFLYAAEVDSKIIVEVLESFGWMEDCGWYARELATGIKVNEGW